MQTSVQGLAEFRATESTPKKSSLLNASARADTASTGSSRPDKWHYWYTVIIITIMISITAQKVLKKRVIRVPLGHFVAILGGSWKF